MVSVLDYARRVGRAQTILHGVVEISGQVLGGGVE